MKKRLLSLFAAGGMVLSLVACGGSDTAPATTAAVQTQEAAPESKKDEAPAENPGDSNDPIIIGFMGWSSGPDAMYGLVPQYLLEYYFKNVNANGGWLGRQIDFRTYDISGLDGDFSEAVNVANRLGERPTALPGLWTCCLRPGLQSRGFILSVSGETIF